MWYMRGYTEGVGGIEEEMGMDGGFYSPSIIDTVLVLGYGS